MCFLSINKQFKVDQLDTMGKYFMIYKVKWIVILAIILNWKSY